MGKYAQIVLGPAGCGKSTYCEIIHKHCENAKRKVHLVNLDPAAEVFNYPVHIDIKDLITVDDVMERLEYGPNGGLVYAMEYLVENIDWVMEEIGDYDDDYLIIDCPGQIELYTHSTILRTVVEQLQQAGYNVCSVFLLDSQFVTDASKFIGGALVCLSAMIRLEVPHVSVLSKVDLLSKENRRSRNIDKFLSVEIPSLIAELNSETNPNMHNLNEAIGSLLEDFSMVSFLPLDINDPDSIDFILQNIDAAIQYGEDTEVHEGREHDENDGDNNDDDDVADDE